MACQLDDELVGSVVVVVDVVVVTCASVVVVVSATVVVVSIVGSVVVVAGIVVTTTVVEVVEVLVDGGVTVVVGALGDWALSSHAVLACASPVAEVPTMANAARDPVPSRSGVRRRRDKASIAAPAIRMTAATAAIPASPPVVGRHCDAASAGVDQMVAPSPAASTTARNRRVDLL